MRSAHHIFFALFAFIAAETAANADVVIDRGSEIVMPTNAPYATRLAAAELNFFLKGVLGEALPVVAQRTEGKTAIVLGGASGDRALPDRDGYVVEARSNVLRIFGNDDDVSDVDATAALPDEAIWQPCFRRGTLSACTRFSSVSPACGCTFPANSEPACRARRASPCRKGALRRRPRFRCGAMATRTGLSRKNCWTTW